MNTIERNATQSALESPLSPFFVHLRLDQGLFDTAAGSFTATGAVITVAVADPAFGRDVVTGTTLGATGGKAAGLLKIPKPPFLPNVKNKLQYMKAEQTHLATAKRCRKLSLTLRNAAAFQTHTEA